MRFFAALLQFGNWYGFGAVVAVYGVGQILESFILTPRLVGERIGLHPLAVIFALLAFGQLFGFFGVLLALPASAVLAAGLRELRRPLSGKCAIWKVTDVNSDTGPGPTPEEPALRRDASEAPLMWRGGD